MKSHKYVSLLLSALAVSTFFSACSATDLPDNSNNSFTGENGAVNNTNDYGIMRDITSAELVKEMKIGWNLGNTLDVCQADRDGDGKVNEHVEDGEEVGRNSLGKCYDNSGDVRQAERIGC